MKSVESEVYSQFKVDDEDYTSQALTESLNQNTFILTRDLYNKENKTIVDDIEKT